MTAPGPVGSVVAAFGPEARSNAVAPAAVAAAEGTHRLLAGEFLMGSGDFSCLRLRPAARRGEAA